MSVFTLSFMGLLPFGAVLAGAMAQQLGPAIVLTIGGGVCATVAFFTLRASPERGGALQLVLLREFSFLPTFFRQASLTGIDPPTRCEAVRL